MQRLCIRKSIKKYSRRQTKRADRSRFPNKTPYYQGMQQQQQLQQQQQQQQQQHQQQNLLNKNMKSNRKETNLLLSTVYTATSLYNRNKGEALGPGGDGLDRRKQNMKKSEYCFVQYISLLLLFLLVFALRGQTSFCCMQRGGPHPINFK